MNKLILLAFCYSTMISCFHGDCYRSIYGQINTSNNSKNIRVDICRYYGKGNYPNCNTVSLNKDGLYELLRLQSDPQNDCNNNCEDGNMPNKIEIKILLRQTESDTVLIDTFFTCNKGYTFSGNDIHLPTITLE